MIHYILFDTALILVIIAIVKLIKWIKKNHKPRVLSEREKNIRYYKINKIPFCPNCVSINIEMIGSQRVGVIEPKTKTTYSANLNPLKPFTFVNKKEKVVSHGYNGKEVITWRCKDCGRMFKK